MTTLVTTDVVNGTVTDATVMNANFSAIKTVVNGNIDNSNIKAGAGINLNKLAQDGASSNQGIGWDGTKWTPMSFTAPSYGVALPGSPSNGLEFILVDSVSAPTWRWRLRYNSTSTKWDFIGGTPLFNEVTASEALAAGTSSYSNLATTGPSVTLPVAGDYYVEIGAHHQNSNGGGSNQASWMSYAIGGTAASDNDALRAFNPTIFSGSRLRLKTGLTAVTLTAKYRVGGGITVGTWENRWMKVTPSQVG